jgi:hypothetical protein
MACCRDDLAPLDSSGSLRGLAKGGVTLHSAWKGLQLRIHPGQAFQHQEPIH